MKMKIKHRDSDTLELVDAETGDPVEDELVLLIDDDLVSAVAARVMDELYRAALALEEGAQGECESNACAKDRG